MVLGTGHPTSQVIIQKYHIEPGGDQAVWAGPATPMALVPEVLLSEVTKWGTDIVRYLRKILSIFHLF